MFLETTTNETAVGLMNAARDSRLDLTKKDGTQS